MTDYNKAMITDMDVATYNILYDRLFNRISEVIMAINIDGITEEDKESLSIMTFGVDYQDKCVRALCYIGKDEKIQEKTISIPLDIFMSYELIPPYSAEGFNEEEWVKFFNENKLSVNSPIFTTTKPKILS